MFKLKYVHLFAEKEILYKISKIVWQPYNDSTSLYPGSILTDVIHAQDITVLKMSHLPIKNKNTYNTTLAYNSK